MCHAQGHKTDMITMFANADNLSWNDICRFCTKIIRPLDINGCWETNLVPTCWGSQVKFRVGPQLISAPRVSYQLFNGLIPDKLYCLHSCDNPLCVNPNHLFLGTQKANVRDMIKKGRANFYGHYGPATDPRWTKEDLRLV